MYESFTINLLIARVLNLFALVLTVVATIGGINAGTLKELPWLKGAIAYDINAQEVGQFYIISFWMSLWEFCFVSPQSAFPQCSALADAQVYSLTSGKSSPIADVYSKALPYVHIAAAAVLLLTLFISLLRFRHIIVSSLAMVACLTQVAAFGTALYYNDWIKTDLEQFFTDPSNPGNANAEANFVSLDTSAWLSSTSVALMLLSTVFYFCHSYRTHKQDKKREAIHTNARIADYY
ncbi:hypothetical protein MIR68_010545 [Amoeboaphelidium protococcarum]|nr:hypothetical protein MIR68_010545 [Amoeboaphelidium protococcarum]KAI3647700.1 hypothetical protein MP228_007921 [Amoeboaphelidium protococcarum]